MDRLRGGGGGHGGCSSPFFLNVLDIFLREPSFEWYCSITQRMFMCCGYGARLHSHENVFQSPLSELSGSAPDSLRYME